MNFTFSFKKLFAAIFVQKSKFLKTRDPVNALFFSKTSILINRIIMYTIGLWGYFLKIYIFDQNSEKWLNTLKSMFFLNGLKI